MTQVIADVIARSIHAANAPLLARLSALESKAPVQPVNGRDGKDIDPVVVKALVAEAVSAFPPPKDGAVGQPGDKGLTGDVGPIGPRGESGSPGVKGDQGDSGVPGPKGDPGEAGLVGPKGDSGGVGPIGQKGDPGDKGDSGSAGASGDIGAKGDKGDPGINGDVGPVGPAGQKGDPGVAGKDADPLQLKSLQDEVTRLREEVIILKSVAVKDGRDGIDGAKGDTGHSVTSALVNNDGRLVLTFSDGTVKEVGVVVGKDGIGRDGKDGSSVDVATVKLMVIEAVSALPEPKDGKDGTSVEASVVKSMVAEAVAAIPTPKDGTNGTNGTNGADGLGFDDLDVAFDEQTGVVLRFVRGPESKEFPIPVPFDAGVWKPGFTYPKGAGVTVKGAFFIAREQTQTRPDDGSVESARAWRLSVKGGRDGKPGRDGKDGGGNA